MTQKISDTQDEIDSKLSGTIVFWQTYPDNLPDILISQYKEVFDQYIKKFTKLYPEVKIIAELTEEDLLVENLKEEVEKGLGPDIIFTRSFKTIPLIKTDTLLPLDQYSIDLWQFRPEAIMQVLYQSKPYGIPFNLNTQALCYNKDKVKEIPETLSELIDQGRKGYSVGIVSRFEDAFWGTGIFGGQLLDSQGRVILDQANGWARWMKWLKDAKNEPNFIFNEDALVLQNAFIESKLAYSVCWSEQIPFLRQSLGPDKFGVALLPGGENTPAAPPLVVSSFLFSSVSSPAQTKIALRFAQFLINTQVQTEMTTKFRAFIPVNKDAVIDARLFPIPGILQEQSQTGFVNTLDQQEKVDEIFNYGRDFYTRVMAGEISPEQAASQLSQIVNAEFE